LLSIKLSLIILEYAKTKYDLRRDLSEVTQGITASFFYKISV